MAEKVDCTDAICLIRAIGLLHVKEKHYTKLHFTFAMLFQQTEEPQLTSPLSV